MWLLVGVLCFSPSHAAAADQPTWMLELNFSVPIATGDYSRQVDSVGGGVGADLARRLGSSPVYLGLDLGWYSFGTESRLVGTGPLTEQISNNTFYMHAVTRIQRRFWFIQPYAEGLVGLRVLFGSRSRSTSGARSFATTFVEPGTVGSWGVGAGLDFVIPLTSDISSLALTLGVRHLWSSEASYAVVAPGTSLGFVVRRSSVDVLMPRFGIGLQF